MQEKTIHQLREQVLGTRFTRGLLLIGVELVDCARGIEVALVDIAKKSCPGPKTGA